MFPPYVVLLHLLEEVATHGLYSIHKGGFNPIPQEKDAGSLHSSNSIENPRIP